MWAFLDKKLAYNMRGAFLGENLTHNMGAFFSSNLTLNIGGLFG